MKLSVVEAYFTGFNQALSKTPFTRVYIDAFAGGGRVKSKEEKIENANVTSDEDLFAGVLVGAGSARSSRAEEMDEQEAEVFRHGSPLLALKVVPGFNEFIFIESDAETMRQLQEQVNEAGTLKGRAIRFIREDANKALMEISRQNWKKRRATIFLDPFALDIHWSTIEAIARTRAMDMWMLFPAMAVNRMLPRNAEVPEGWAQRLNETFGDSSWREQFYAPPSLPHNEDFFPHLLPVGKATKLDDPFGRLSRYVTGRLKTVFADTVDEPLVLKTEMGSPLFLLCFAVANEKGAPIANRIASHIIKKQQHGR